MDAIVPVFGHVASDIKSNRSSSSTCRAIACMLQGMSSYPPILEVLEPVL